VMGDFRLARRTQDFLSQSILFDSSTFLDKRQTTTTHDARLRGNRNRNRRHDGPHAAAPRRLPSARFSALGFRCRTGWRPPSSPPSLALALAFWAVLYLPHLISIDCDCDYDYDPFHGHNDGSCAVGCDSRLATPHGHLPTPRTSPSPSPPLADAYVVRRYTPYTSSMLLGPGISSLVPPSKSFQRITKLGLGIWDFDGPWLRDLLMDETKLARGPWVG
jgi:hypothetical protein